jgi:hypothetical protein
MQYTQTIGSSPATKREIVSNKERNLPPTKRQERNCLTKRGIISNQEKNHNVTKQRYEETYPNRSQKSKGSKHSTNGKEKSLKMANKSSNFSELDPIRNDPNGRKSE